MIFLKLNYYYYYSEIQNVKHIFDSFTIDAIMRTGFGIQVDSLNEPNNPIIVHGRKMFQAEVTLVDLMKFGTIFFLPKLAKLLNVQVQVESAEFFTKLSLDIIKQKREELSRRQPQHDQDNNNDDNDNLTEHQKANSFIEFMFEAEEEYKRLIENGTEKSTQLSEEKRSIKCKLELKSI